jgi:hypothetical protein
MTVSEIIEKLKELPPTDRLIVKAFLDENLVGERSGALFDDFTLLGSDDGCDISYAEAAQAEVVAETSNSAQL